MREIITPSASPLQQLRYRICRNMHIARIVFAVLAVTCSVSARGYGPGTGTPGGSYGGIGSGIGGRFGSGGGFGGIGGMVGRGYFPTGVLQGAPGSGGYISGSYGSISGAGVGIYGQNMAPKPFKVSYEAPDGQGGVQFKTESGDGSGSVQGTYGYRDAQGLYRVVEYVADQNGYRAAVNTNEPGVDGKENPADVSMTVEKTPAGIQEKYTPVASLLGTGVRGLSPFGRGGPTGGYPGRLGGGIGGPAPGGHTGAYGSMGGMSPVPGITGSVGGSSGLFSGIPKSTTGKSAY